MDLNKNILCQQLDASTELYVSLALLRNVKNSKRLREKVMEGALKCAIMKPSLIVDPFQVIVAANKAALSHASGTMITKSVFTELLFNLSISKNISQSLMKFGIHDDDTDVLVATINKIDSSSISEIISEIDGQVVALDQLKSICDLKLVSKSYKLSETELKTSVPVDLVVSRIATCDFIAY